MASERYYYLINGKEDGPLSHSAISALLGSGQLGGALIRNESEKTWRTPEELGLVSSVAAPVKKSEVADSDTKFFTFGNTLVAIALVALLGYAWIEIWVPRSILNAQTKSDSNTEANAINDEIGFTLGRMRATTGELDLYTDNGMQTGIVKWNDGTYTVANQQGNNPLSGQIKETSHGPDKCVGIAGYEEGSHFTSAICVASRPATINNCSGKQFNVRTGEIYHFFTDSIVCASGLATRVRNIAMSKTTALSRVDAPQNSHPTDPLIDKIWPGTKFVTMNQCQKFVLSEFPPPARLDYPMCSELWRGMADYVLQACHENEFMARKVSDKLWSKLLDNRMYVEECL